MKEKENENENESALIELDKNEEIKENKINAQILKEENSPYSKDNENIKLLSSREEKAKNELITVLRDLEKELNCDENRKKNINEIYKKYLVDYKLTQKEIPEESDNCSLTYVIYFITPLFGIIFLIGIFQLISLKNALFDLVIESGKSYYKCNYKSNCIISFNNKTDNVFQFYDYFFNSTMKESIDFNLMMITGGFGDCFIKSKGFRKSNFYLFIITLVGILWLYSFDFNFEIENVFNYKFIKIICIFLCYLIILIGVGGSALLSHTISIEYYLKYKNYIIIKKRKKLEENKIMDENEIETNLSIDERKKREEKREKKKGENLDKKENNKFDFFFMICITTIIGYSGKRIINIILNNFLEYLYGEKYNKVYFFYYVIGIYIISIFISINILYSCFKIIFKKNKNKQINTSICSKLGYYIKCECCCKEEEEKEKHQIYQICGYVFYKEKKIINKSKKIGCFKLFLESINNCCNEVGCSPFKYWLNDDKCNCCCCHCCNCCDYNENDYDKTSQLFCYCYQAQRKSFSCNTFFTNSTQKKITPFILEYFLLKLLTIGFDKQIEENIDKQYEHRKTLIFVYILTFIFYFYFSFSFSKYFKEIHHVKDNQIEKNSENSKEEFISKMSKEILYGTHGIVFFNGLFSFIFSLFYFPKISNDYKNFFFNVNINYIFIPVLMNKLYFFTLNYYCSYTVKKNKGFELMPRSTLMAIYLKAWDTILIIIKSCIPEGKDIILYIIQFVFSSFLSLIILFLILKLCFYSFYNCICHKCDFKEFALHKFCFYFISFILCGGGIWIKYNPYESDLSFDCCYDCYCIGQFWYCDDCCCCDFSSCCYCEFCEKNINGCDLYWFCCDCCDCCDCCNNIIYNKLMSINV